MHHVKEYGVLLLKVGGAVAVLSMLLPGVAKFIGIRPMPLFPSLPFPLGIPQGATQAASASSAPVNPSDSGYTAAANSILA